MPSSPVTSTGALQPGTGSSSTISRTDGAGAFGEDTFVKLLIAQMTHQDPTAPTDSAQMMTQLAQFSSVEGLNKLNKQMTALNLSQDFASALTMMGKQVTWLDDNGEVHTGAVEGVKPSSKGAILTVGGSDIFTGQVAKVA